VEGLDFVRQLAARLARRDVTAEAVVRAAIERIEADDGRIKAWSHFDPSQALAQARSLDANALQGVFHGLAVGIKDLMDTMDMPTAYGSPIYAGHRPLVDAAAVAAVRGAGGVILGKTVTTEFATFNPGPTVNPHSRDKPFTPGGSSSGSAAAVAAGMVPLAFGTQTAGSIIRPAAYCGVVGYKPTFGTLPTAGIKPLAPSLDTLGVLARNVDDAAWFVGALARLPLVDMPSGSTPLRVGLCGTPHWDRAQAAARAAFGHAADAFKHAGAIVTGIILPSTCDGLDAMQITVMEYEAAAAFAPEALHRARLFSPAFAALVARGAERDGCDFFDAQKSAEAARKALEKVWDVVDVLLCPSTEGEAPAGLEGTGDPIFNRIWSLLGNPCVHVPVGSGPQGMPVGVTIVGRRHADSVTLAAARLLEQELA